MNAIETIPDVRSPAAVHIARQLYEGSGLNFDEVRDRHMAEGIVLASPRWFLMLRVENWRGGAAWFVECAVGNLAEIAALVTIRFPRVVFCRIKNGRKITKCHETNRLLRLIQREVSMLSQ